MSFIEKFIHWLKRVISGESQPNQAASVFGKDTTSAVSWREGEGIFICEGVLPNNTQLGCFYRLECKAVRASRTRTSYEVRCANENALSKTPTHKFTLTYQKPVILNGSVSLSAPIFVFNIEVSCFIPVKSASQGDSWTASQDWIAVMNIAPAIRDEIIAICWEGSSEEKIRIKGTVLKEGQKFSDLAPEKRKSKAERIEQYNTRKLWLTPYPSLIDNQSEKKWREFILEKLAQIENPSL
jgi:hypothetical protein